MVPTFSAAASRISASRVKPKVCCSGALLNVMTPNDTLTLLRLPFTAARTAASRRDTPPAPGAEGSSVQLFEYEVSMTKRILYGTDSSRWGGAHSSPDNVRRSLNFAGSNG